MKAQKLHSATFEYDNYDVHFDQLTGLVTVRCNGHPDVVFPNSRKQYKPCDTHAKVLIHCAINGVGPRIEKADQS